MCNSLFRKTVFAVYAYQLANVPGRESSIIVLNIFKGISYIPVIGALAYSIFGAIVLSQGCPDTKRGKAALAALAFRYVFTVLAPFVLPIIDLIGSLWLLHHKKQKHNSYYSPIHSATSHTPPAAST